MIKLTIIIGQSQTEFELDQFPITFGRTPDNTIQIAETNSSRNHCRIEKTQQGYKIVDMESKNGTKLNDKFMNQSLLKSGDEIGIGATRIIFEDLTPPKPQQAGVASRPGQARPAPARPATRPPSKTPAGAPGMRRQPPTERGERQPYQPRQKSSGYLLPVIIGVAIVIVIGVVIGLSAGGGRSTVKEVGEKDQYDLALEDMKNNDFETAINRLENVKADSSKYAQAQEKLKECRQKLADQKLAACEQHWTDTVDFIKLNPNCKDEQKIRIYKKHLSKYPDTPHKAEAIQKLAELGASPD